MVIGPKAKDRFPESGSYLRKDLQKDNLLKPDYTTLEGKKKKQKSSAEKPLNMRQGNHLKGTENRS